jgi:hypothetical protein
LRIDRQLAEVAVDVVLDRGDQFGNVVVDAA